MVMSEKGRFVKIVCARCGNNQVTYGKASMDVKCLKCNKLLVKTSGGKIRIRTIVRGVFWRR